MKKSPLELKKGDSDRGLSKDAQANTNTNGNDSELEIKAKLDLEKEKAENKVLRKQIRQKELELEMLVELNKIQKEKELTNKNNNKYNISLLNSFNSESWKLTDEELYKQMYFDERNQVYMLPTPVRKHNHSIIELYDDYLITLPIADYESIEWIKNLYSDVNIKVICDGHDNRKGCDIKLDQKYDYNSLYKKTYFSMDYICKNIYNKTDKKIKFFAKMDFDVVVNKKYLYSVIKFISDNSHLRIYFGNSSPFRDREGVEMNGQFYAISGALLDEYCNCDIPEAQGNGEDLWFALALHQCITDKYPPEERKMLYIENSRDWLKHGGYSDKGVELKLGRHTFKDKEK
ncbi:hypothetical protein BB560_000165 [Smittium megazygosporum]|uniref:Hexosyltransferase n=1 Tax=Smittium megazygosporum TaxID=133381 RepID=A0A2T9ZLA4_9FUNG|nr:hypothetical protein BB560_000165 [Smittium megazygosporum]